MANPFLRRATEYVREDESFLSIVSPAPLTTFLATNKHKDDMFEVPVRIIGAPGSGKTMLATLAEFRMVETILQDESNPINRALADALGQAGFLKEGKPHVAAVRIPMESEYRDFWELPYEPAVKTKLAFWLVQARAMLGLIRSLTANKTRDIVDIQFIPRATYEAHLEQIGGLTAIGIRDRALAVQRAIYSVGAGLRAPKLENLPADAIAPYAPFDAISKIRIDWMGEEIELSPLVMLDDVHALHHEQLQAMFEMLSHREMKFGRWMMMRLDALSPGAVLRSTGTQPTHNRAKGRDFVDIRMQGDEKKEAARKQFRTMARDMAKRYLPMIEALRNRNATDVDRLLPAEPPKLTPGQIKELSLKVDKDQAKLSIGPSRRKEIDSLVDEYIKRTKSYDDRPEVALAMTRILLHRYAIRIARATPSLFEEIDPDPRTPLKADSDVAHGARLHLYHEYDRPLHYGVDAICDASNENAEVFLQFAGELVANIETRAIRNNPLPLPARSQQSILTKKAKAMMDAWAFPNAQRVRDLVDAMGQECREESLLPNAPLGPGANAIAVLEEEMEALSTDDEVGSVLKHAIANGAVTIERNYGQGGKQWALVELTGTVNLAYGLTFNRGGFLPKTLDYIRFVTGASNA
ncbi:hypothetical protein [Rhizobium tumorigenes]|uniref:Uncharacterized protein n=1 Tax=Rhizobium tumorigenes TaxID=2041385 RepID=A0AAF1KEW8_9HYPH|nr:hypothetical protein [Rhizobium tumorigenes]WFR97517.1 hypothetical protein PR017_20060 [Rhizobium tumorigenes]